MYTPAFNKVVDRATLIQAMQAYSFAILLGPGCSQPEAEMRATHLPLIVRDEGPHGTLLGHFARANSHWAALERRESLVVFPGPHSYVSPSIYSEPLSVPTWNYIAVHAHGTLETIEDHGAKNGLVEGLIQQHEPAYLERWRKMPDGYRRTMLAGIVGFRIPIARIEGKFKLSQNRNATERDNIYRAQASGSDDEQQLALWMQRLNLVSSPQESRTP